MQLPTSLLLSSISSVRFLKLSTFRAVVLVFALIFFTHTFASTASAQPAATSSAPSATEASEDETSAEGWAEDPRVTEVGKAAVRGQDFLRFQIENEQNDLQSIAKIAVDVRNLCYILFILVLVGAGILLMITRGRNIKLLRFLPYSLLMLVWITFSFPVTEFVYRSTDALTLNFLNNTTTENLYLIQFNAKYGFKGYRRTDPIYNEAANVNLTLVQLTTFTYYVMGIMLMLRKIIMMFLIIVSPFIALLLPFPLIKNTAKIWIGEFFRWLFYWPLFAIFLMSVVRIWQSGIPLNFTGSPQNAVVYPTATSILIAGPGIQAGLRNNVNNPQTFALYIIGLIMLWAAMILPWILLRIFRDFNGGAGEQNNQVMAGYKALSNALLGRGQPQVPPSQPGGAGMAKSLANASASVALPYRAAVNRNQNISNATIHIDSAQIDANLPKMNTNDILRIAGINIPTMRDLARADMNRMQKGSTENALSKNLSQLHNPNQATNDNERRAFNSIKKELETRAGKGDRQADAVIKAAQTSASSVSAGSGGGPSGSSAKVVGRAIKSTPTAGGKVNATASPIVPAVNKVQSVSIDDYEQVKNMWAESYQTGDVPTSEVIKSREEWIKADIAKMETLIGMMSSLNSSTRSEAMTEVSTLLPFILLGGFSETEIVAYLRAKMEGAKEVLKDLEKEKDKENLLDVDTKVSKEEPKTLAQEMAKDIPGNISDNAFTKINKEP